MPTHSCNPEQQVTLLVVIVGVSVLLQAVAAWIAVLQIKIVFGRYRLDPLWRQIETGQVFNSQQG